MDTSLLFLFFFFNDTATTEIYTFPTRRSSDLRRSTQPCSAVGKRRRAKPPRRRRRRRLRRSSPARTRSEEHTSELQSPHLGCRLLLEKTTKTPPAPSLLLTPNSLH